MNHHELLTELSNITHESVFASAIRSNPAGAIEMIKAQAKDNRVLVCEIVGENLVTVIENFEQ